MGDLKQQGRFAELTTPLGQDRLVFQRMNAHEGLSELFEFDIGALSEEDDIDFDSAIGENCCVKLNCADGVKRYFNGVLTEAEWTGIHESLFTYTLVLRPWLWILSHTSDCRFFQDKAAPDIIKEVFDKAGFSDYEMNLTES